jgi:hypothetical protein
MIRLELLGRVMSRGAFPSPWISRYCVRVRGGAGKTTP